MLCHCWHARVEGGDRAGMEQHTGGLTSDPVLERDSGLCSNTILPAYSPLWLPAATHNEDHCRGLPGQKGPPERRLPSGGLSALFLRSTSGHCLEREEKLNNGGDTRGTMVFRGHLNPQQTVSTSVGSG